jgi:hypothetical protein
MISRQAVRRRLGNLLLVILLAVSAKAAEAGTSGWPAAGDGESRRTFRATAPAARGSAIHWYAVVVAGDNAQPVFDNARRRVADLLARLGYAGAGLRMLSADPQQLAPGVGPATIAGLDAAFEHVPADPQTGCILFLTSHGSPDGIYLSWRNEFLSPSTLNRILGAHCGNRPTIAILSACYAGAFADPIMQDPNRIILAAARRDRSSFGCGNDFEYTYFDEELIRLLPRRLSWMDLYQSLCAAIARREYEHGYRPSEPQAFFGAAWSMTSLRQPDATWLGLAASMATCT